MTITPSIVIASNPGDDQIDLSKPGSTNPPTVALEFGVGSGRDVVTLNGPMYRTPMGYIQDPVSPYVLRLGSGLTAADVQLVQLADYKWLADASGRLGMSTYTAWELRIKNTGDLIRFTNRGEGHDAVPYLAQIEFSDGTSWSPQQVLAQLQLAENSESTVYGTSGADVLRGDARSRALLGADGDDTLHSGAGDETLRGGRGKNTYVITAGNGQDTIVGDDFDGGSLVQFGAGISAGSVQARRDDGDLYLSLPGGHSLRVLGFMAANVNTGQAISRFDFADGTSWSFDEVFKRLAQTPTADNDVLKGLAGAELLSGGLGNDTISGFGGTDTLLGGDGRDELSAASYFSVSTTVSDPLVVDGGRGNDQISLGTGLIQFGAAFGQDVVLADLTSAATTIEFKDGLKKSNATFYSDSDDPNDLVILFAATGDSVRLRGVFSAPLSDATGAKIKFADGSVVTVAQLQIGTGVTVNSLDRSVGKALTGKAGADTLTATGGNDTITDTTGSDTINTTVRGGHDRLDLSQGAATDRDVVRVTGVVRQADINVTTALLDWRDVRVTFGHLGQLDITGFAADAAPDRLTLVFDDGTRLTLGELRSRTRQGTSGDDQFYVKDGVNESYTFGVGSGQDAIYGFKVDPTDPSKADQVVLTTQDVIFSRYAETLGLPVNHPMYRSGIQITVNGTGDRLRVGNGDLWLADQAPVVRFPDGSTLTGRQVAALADAQSAPVTTALTLQGTFTNDNLSGGLADDLITAGQGHDLIDLRDGGMDTVQAWRGDGDDTVLGDVDVLRLRGVSVQDVVMSGTDLVHVMEKGRSIYSLTADTLRSIEFDDGRVLARADLVGLGLAGSLFNDRIQGGDGNELIQGQQGSDTLWGGQGHDTLDGGDGSDVLYGQDGDDVLHAGADASSFKTLNGGAGRDTFRLASGEVHVSITDDLADGGADEVIFDAASTDFEFSVRDSQLVLSSQTPRSYVSIEGYFGPEVGQSSVGFLKFSDGVTLDVNAAYARALSPSTAGADVIEGSSWAEALLSGAGDDAIWGYGGKDTIVAGTGQDQINGGAGDDVIRYARGDGVDLIRVVNQEAVGDVLEFGVGITAADIVVISPPSDTNITSHMSLLLKDGSGGVSISAYDNDGTNASVNDLGRVKFADGTVLLASELYARRVSNVATTGADTLWADVGLSWTGSALDGGKGNDVLYGNRGQDTLTGGDGNDTLRGSGDADFLLGGKGSDTYLFNRGDGQDRITENDATWFVNDLLKVGGATSKQLWFTQNGSSLDISVIGTQDKVTIDGWFLGSANKVEKITASDGKSLTAAKVQTLVNAMASFTPPADGVTTLPASTPTSVTKVIASSWV